MFDIAQMPSGGFYTLKTDIGANTAPGITVNIFPAPKYEVDDGGGGITSTLLTALPVVLGPDQINADRVFQGESAWLNAGVEQSDGSANYTLAYRGQLNTWASNPPTASYSANYKEHKIGDVVHFDYTGLIRGIYNTFLDGSETLTEEAGEALDATSDALTVSLHSDGKLYKYHATNYPTLAGMIPQGSNYASGATATYKAPGATVTGLTGLTPGATLYAEETGAYTHTASSTTKVVGFALTATTAFLFAAPTELEKASTTDAETGTDDTKYMTAQKTKEAVTKFAGIQVVSAELAEALSLGAPVRVYDDEGTLKCRKPKSGTISETNLVTGTVNDISACPIAPGKFVVGYEDSSVLHVAVATISADDSTISFGTPVSVDTNNTSPGARNICKLAEDKFVITYTDNGDTKIEAVAGTVSGTTISLGSKVDIDSAGSYNGGPSVCQIEEDKFAVIYSPSATTIEMVVCTVSGTVITVGAAQSVATVASRYQDGERVIKVAEGKVVCIYLDNDTSDTAKAKAATISGTTATFGSEATLLTTSSISTGSLDALAWEEDKGVISVEDVTQTEASIVVFGVEGTSIEVGSVIEAEDGDIGRTALEKFSDGRGYFFYEDKDDSDSLKYKTFEISGLTATMFAGGTIKSSDINYLGTAFDDEGRLLVVYEETSSSDLKGYAFIETRPYVVGLLSEAGSATDEKDLHFLGNILPGFSSLVPGRAQYIDESGDLTDQDTGFPIARNISTTQVVISKNP